MSPDAPPRTALCDPSEIPGHRLGSPVGIFVHSPDTCPVLPTGASLLFFATGALGRRRMPRLLSAVVLLGLTAACKPADQGLSLPQRGKDGLTVALASPVGEVQPGDRIIAWHPADGASRYEIVLSDSLATPIFTSVTRDTQVVLPDRFEYSLTQNYRWYVTAYRDRDSTAWRSPIAVFRLHGEGRRMPPRPAP